MDTPLDQIQQWYLSREATHQDDLGALASHFLLDPEPFSGTQLLRITNFAKQLDSDGMGPKQVVQKTLYMIKLIDFTLSGRATDQDWAETLDKLLYMRTKFTEQGDPGAVNQMLDNFQERKAGWIGVAESWASLTSGKLNNKKIADWYFLNMAGKKDK